MPAIQVARTDTFELQRQKINQIGSQVFSITQGGSDLATGNLKLGDGTRSAPSLAFTSDASLGIYKSADQSFGFVSSSKKIADFTPSGFYNYRDVILQQKTIVGTGISILDIGQNYDAGSYSDISLVGGSGEFATANIDVTEYSGTVTNTGANYTNGSYSGVSLDGGSGSGASINFNVDALLGDILSAGTGYIPGNYTGVALTGGSGSGAIADLDISGNITYAGSITNAGTGYPAGTQSNLNAYNLPRQTFTLTAVSNPGSPPPDNVYAVDAVIQDTLTFEKGNTYRFDVSDSSLLTHPLSFVTSTDLPLNQNYYTIDSYGIQGNAGSYVYLIISPDAPTETIKYICTSHTGMGASINIVSGTTGSYGSGALVNIDVAANGTVDDVSFLSPGSNYKVGDVITVFTITGSGFEYTISGVTYEGVVQTVTITDNGIDYENGDILSFNNSSVGGLGSGFQYSISSNPGKITNVFFASKGTGYAVGDVLTLFGTISNVTGQLKGEVTNVSSTLSTASTTVTVASTVGIVAGMIVTVLQGSTGELDQGEVTVVSVDSSTEVTISSNPTVDGPANLRFISPGNLTEIVVSSVAGISLNSVLQKVSGDGELDTDTLVTGIDIDTNTITVNKNPTRAGATVINFIQPYGSGNGLFAYEIERLGSVESFTISSGGNGYAVGDTLSVNPLDLTQPIPYSVGSISVQSLLLSTPVPTGTFVVGGIVKLRDGGVDAFTTDSSPSTTQTVVSGVSTTLSDASAVITVASTTGIVAGMLVSQDQGGTGVLGGGGNTTVLSVDSATQITLSDTPLTSGSATLNFTSDESGSFFGVASTTNSANGTGATFNVIRDVTGNIAGVTVDNIGYFYESGDTITISGSLVGGSSPTHDIELTLVTTSQSEEVEIYDLEISGSNITSILVSSPAVSFQDSEIILKNGTTDTFIIDTASTDEYRFTIDINDGSGAQLAPDLSLYSGNTYQFNVSAISAIHDFAFSTFEGGDSSPSLVENISTTLSNLSDTITVASTTGILPGMLVTITSGSGDLVQNTVVESVVNSTTVQLSNNPVTSGPVVLSFSGVEYTDGVTKSSDFITIRVSDTTPSLYYYCKQSGDAHSREGKKYTGFASITIDLNNPKIFGSGLSIYVAELLSSNNIILDLLEGSIRSTSLNCDDGTFDVATIASLSATDILSNTLTTPNISSSGNLAISATSVNVSADLNVGSNLQIARTSGNITTAGVIKTTNSLNVNDYLIIDDNVISSTSGSDITLTPSTGRVAKVNTNTSLNIPSGSTNERPGPGVREDGSIRFNTDTNQYEGYSDATSSWSSLGGVRDIDGNTYILAELTPGANDNTLWFYNDNINTLKLTTQFLDFRSVKKISSGRLGLPAFTTWSANTAVSIGQYLKYRNNIYEVTGAGITGTSGNEPTHSSGVANNGTAQLTWYSSAVSPLEFTEVEELRVGPNKDCPLIVSSEIKLLDNTISTLVQDLVVSPNSGKKVTIDAPTSLVIPVGNTNQRGSASQGSIRFNTTISQFEGYSGTNWSSLGGVRDVDGNTYIIPETAPAANENILYFYNDGTNTLQLSSTGLDFTNIDTITTSGGNTLALNTEIITLDNSATTIDNTDATSSFISTTKQYLDLGLSAGLTVDPVLRLDDQGDVYLNTGFGTGTFSGVKIFDGALKDFELADYLVRTSVLSLEKGVVNSGATILYNTATAKGCRVTVVSKSSTGKKSMVEYNVIDNGTDIFHNEFGSLNTSIDGFEASFDITPGNEIRITLTLSDDHAPNDTVEITLLTQVVK